MPYYLEFLKKLQQEGVGVVASAAVAESLGLSEIQVRKDFAAVSLTGGKPKSGFSIDELIEHMQESLGYKNKSEAVLVGAGSLGRALLSYKGFEAYGLKIIAAFDKNDSVVGAQISGVKILHAQKISDMCRRLCVPIGIITVPADEAQIVCDQLVAGGVEAIWNFAPIRLSAPRDTLVQNENMAESLALL